MEAQRLLIRLPIIIMFISISLLVIIPTAKGAALDAKLDKVVLTPTPNLIGVGGEVTLDAAVYIYGGCCYHLWAYDVSPELTLPEDVQLVSGPSPLSYDEVDGIPGGEPVVVHFQWKIKSMIVGLHNFNVTINTKNCGKVSANCTLRIVRGCAISEPERFQSSSGDTVITVFSTSYMEGIDVEEVGLFYLTEKEVSQEEKLGYFADNNTLLRGGAIDSGVKVDVIPIENSEGYWRGTIDTPDEICTVYYWIVATDNNGENTTSPVYQFNVEDEERRDLIVAITFWSLLFGTIVGIIIIVVIHGRLTSSRPVSQSSRGLLILGMSRFPRVIKNLERTSIDPAYQRKLRNRRLIIGSILALIGLAFLFWAISTGQFEALLSHIEEGN